MTQSLTPLTGVTEADWYGARLSRVTGRVDSVIPGGYPAYARVLHPATAASGASVSWADVAASTGHTLHPLAQFHRLAGRWERDSDTEPVGWPGENPSEGSLDLELLTVLQDLLARHTGGAEDCWFAVWEGFGGFPKRWRTSPRVRQPGREYYLFAGSLDSVAELSARLFDIDEPGDAAFSGFTVMTLGLFDDPPAESPQPERTHARPVQTPNEWWPRDRAWCVATEIDFDSTLVAGTVDLIREIVEHPELEAFEVAEQDDLTYEGDHVNPAPPSPSSIYAPRQSMPMRYRDRP